MKKHTFIFASLGLALSVMVSCGGSETTSSKDEKVQTENQKDSEESSSNDVDPEVSEMVSPYEWLVPKGYVLYDSLSGDLNGDGFADHVAIVKGTDPKNWEMNQFDEKVDCNRRGIVISMTQGAQSNIVTENLDCFSSENEDGGVYYAPELDFEIKKGKLYIQYGHGRYGHWWYTFRYQDGKMKLIGYDNNVNRGPITEYSYSYNFLTGRKLTKENINMYLDEEDAQEVFKETWSDIPKKPLLTLSSIKDFDGLSSTFD